MTHISKKCFRNTKYPFQESHLRIRQKRVTPDESPKLLRMNDFKQPSGVRQRHINQHECGSALSIGMNINLFIEEAVEEGGTGLGQVLDALDFLRISVGRRIGLGTGLLIEIPYRVIGLYSL